MCLTQLLVFADTRLDDSAQMMFFSDVLVLDDVVRDLGVYPF